VNRGSVVSIALQGDFGKPRPALVIQSSLFEELLSVTVLPITSELRDAPLYRVTVTPSQTNGLRRVSQIMVDKAVTVRREKVGEVFGQLDDDTMLAVTRAMALFLGVG
jgi:mRNA interferase MazF